MIEPGIFATHSPAETEALGRRMGAAIDRSEILLLEGELGAGKTLLARGIVAGLGADPDLVSSPTFTLVNEYEGGRLPVLHLDLYRIGGGSQRALYELGLEELFDRKAVVIVEWAEYLADFPAPAAWRVRLAETGDEAREIVVATVGEKAPDR